MAVNDRGHIISCTAASTRRRGAERVVGRKACAVARAERCGRRRSKWRWCHSPRLKMLS
jgi:hypothetical protein